MLPLAHCQPGPDPLAHPTQPAHRPTEWHGMLCAVDRHDFARVRRLRGCLNYRQLIRFELVHHA